MTFVYEKERITALVPGGKPAGSADFPQISPGLVSICRVTVLPEFRGQGVAEALMEAALSHLETQGKKAALMCATAQDYVADHPQWKHLLPGTIHITTH